MNKSRRFHRRQTILTWLTVCLLILLQVQFLPTFSVSNSDVIASKATQSEVQANYGKLPLAFEPNQGQVDGAASFLVHHGQATTYFDGLNTTATVGDDQITMSLDGANASSFTGTDQLESKTNYFIGNDQSKWHSDVPNYKQLLAKNVYPGIDLKYYGTNSQLEHDFIVSPETDYRQIAFHFDGQQDLSLDKDGNLVMKTGESDLRLNAPVTYQQTANTKHTIPSQFELKDNKITIALNGDYDHSQPLIIDPVLIYSTYLGGSGDDHPYAIAVDSGGNAYISGSTVSTNYPTSSPYQASNAGGAHDVFVTKLNAAGSALTYSTYLGGTGDEVSWAIAVDSSGSAYISGYTGSTNYPTASPFQASKAAANDAFITKFNPAGSALVYSTYLGGNGDEALFDVGIAVDSSGSAYVTGQTSSTTFPTSSPFQASNTGGGSDAFVFKLNPSGSALAYSTYLGGSTANESGNDIVVDASGNAYIAGITASTNFPTSSPFQASKGGGSYDGFITKLNAAGSALTYSTYLGGSGLDTATGIAIDLSGNAYISGITDSTNFPTSSPFQASNGGGVYDVTVTKLNSAGSALTYSTYLGGSGTDMGLGIGWGLNGDAYITGQTSSTNFPTSSPFQASNGGGAYDAFIFQMTEHSVNLTAQVDPTLSFTVGSTSCALGTLSVSQAQQCTYTLTASTNGTSGYTISYLPVVTLTSGANTITALSALTASTLNTEQFGINLRANTAVGSNTAGAFGADVSGGSGTVASAYNTVDSFKLVAAGDTVSSSASPSLASTYTVSTIANIGATTEAGAYTTTLTYNIVAGY
jgi:hypothetical protein